MPADSRTFKKKELISISNKGTRPLIPMMKSSDSLRNTLKLDYKLVFKRAQGFS
jgi:hypothetical protein